MSKKRYILVALGVITVLLGSLFYSIVLSTPGGTYDHWMDLNDDGVIDAVDLQLLAFVYGASGTPINKTKLLLDLEARIGSLNMTLHLDYYNKTDCDSLFALLAHMHSASDISGGTLNVDQIRLGTWEGSRYIYFYDSGTPFGEYITWLDSGDRFWLSDDTHIAGTLTISSTTRYYSIPGLAWMPYRDNYVVFRTSAYVYTSTSGYTHWFAAVNLPHGAVVTEFRVWVLDNDPTDISVYLSRLVPDGTSYQMVIISSSGASPTYRQLSTDIISYATIDNENYAYYVYGIMRSGWDTHQLGSVQITYVINEPLP